MSMEQSVQHVLMNAIQEVSVDRTIKWLLWIFS
jgi:hypothetical protein